MSVDPGGWEWYIPNVWQTWRYYFFFQPFWPLSHPHMLTQDLSTDRNQWLVFRILPLLVHWLACPFRRQWKKNELIVKDSLLDDSLYETSEIRIFFFFFNYFLINLTDFNPFRQSFTGNTPLKYVFFFFFFFFFFASFHIKAHTSVSLFLFIATRHDVICKTGQI